MANLVKFPTKYKGVRYVENKTRKLKNGTFDTLFYIRYRCDGVLKEECLGSASEGWNAEKASKIRSELREAQKTGKGIQTFRGLRELARSESQIKASEEQAEAITEMTLGEFFNNHYLPRSKREKRSWKTDEQRFNKLINPALGHIPLSAMQQSHIQNFLDELCDKGLKATDRQRRIVFHSLRHTFASWMALAGVDIYRIKTLMRHKTLEMTMRYAHLIPDATHDAVYQLAPPPKRELKGV